MYPSVVAIVSFQPGKGESSLTKITFWSINSRIAYLIQVN